MSSAELRYQNLTDMIVARVRAALEASDWSQAELARRMGKSPAEVSRWLSGNHNLSLRTLAKLEDAFGVSLLEPTVTAQAPPISRADLIAALQEFFANRQDVAKVELFGSFVRKEEHLGSDIDLLVTFRPGTSVTLITLAELRLLLEERLGREVDVLDHRMLTPKLRKTIAAEKITVYEQAA